MGNPLAFGAGIHACLGQQLAKQEIYSGIQALLDRLENFELTRALPDPAYVYSLNFRPLKEFPIRFTRRASAPST